MHYNLHKWIKFIGTFDWTSPRVQFFCTFCTTCSSLTMALKNKIHNRWSMTQPIHIQGHPLLCISVRNLFSQIRLGCIIMVAIKIFTFYLLNITIQATLFKEQVKYMLTAKAIHMCSCVCSCFRILMTSSPSGNWSKSSSITCKINCVTLKSIWRFDKTVQIRSSQPICKCVRSVLVDNDRDQDLVAIFRVLFWGCFWSACSSTSSLLLFIFDCHNILPVCIKIQTCWIRHLVSTVYRRHSCRSQNWAALLMLAIISTTASNTTVVVWEAT